MAKAKTVRMIGKYQIDGKPLGTGGMATVYKVLSNQGKVFAAKVLHAHLNKERKIVNRFKQEYEIGYKLNSPAFVSTYELFKDDGAWVMILEFVDGITLQKALSKGVLTEQHSTSIVAELAKSLSYFHKFKLVHRDLKPENIMLTRKGQMKVMDYGITREMDSQMTKTNTAIGTPIYMAPEQIINAKGTDNRCDIYSLGLIYFRLLTRRDCHGLSNNSEFYDIIEARQTKPVRKVKDLKDLQIQDILVKALAPSVEKRFSSCEGLYKELSSLSSFSKFSSKMVKTIIKNVETVKKAPSKVQKKAQKQKETVPYKSQVDSSGFGLKKLVITAAAVAFLVIGVSVWIMGPSDALEVVKSFLSK